MQSPTSEAGGALAATQSQSPNSTTTSRPPSPSTPLSTSKSPSTSSLTSEPSSKPLWRRVRSALLNLVITHHLPFLLGLATLLGYLFPNVARSPNGAIKAQYTILYGAVAATFLVSGLNLPTNKLASQARNWRLHLLVQSFSFLITPAIVQAIVQIIIASGAVTSTNGQSSKIDPSILAGMILTSAIPTTIASNVVMTRMAGGSESAAVTQVLLGNVLGPFLTPAWTDVLIPDTSVFAEIRAARVGGAGSSSGLTEMYIKVFKYLALAVYLPLCVGQILRALFPTQTSFALRKFYLGKIGMVAMILLVWTTMSTCFYEGAFTSVGGGSIALTCALNVGLYILFAALIFGMARPPVLFKRWFSLRILVPWRKSLGDDAEKQDSSADRRHVTISPVYTFPAEETIAAIFCGPAKTTALGIPLLYAMWTIGVVRARMSIPVVLYTTEQIFIAHFVVGLMQRWKHKIDRKRTGETLSTQGGVLDAESGVTGDTLQAKDGIGETNASAEGKS